MHPAHAIDLHPIPPPGPWAVAVSGGADSVALLLLMSRRPDLSLHVVHLDHQLRGDASTQDARFVADLAEALALPCTIARREDLEFQLQNLPKNPSARFRALRLELFAHVVQQENLQGLALAHHADDQAETILLRLLRGKGPTTPAGLAGMFPVSRLRGITLIRPLLHVRRADLHNFLCQAGQVWREDQTNQSDRYARNRIRRFLDRRPDLFQPILELGQSCRDYSQWIRQNSPHLESQFFCRTLARLPAMLARQSARRWLIARGSPPDDLTPAVLDRLRQMAADAATPPRRQFPGNLLIRRRSARIQAEPSPPR